VVLLLVSDDKHIAIGDGSGVAIAAMNGLNREGAAETDASGRENAALNRDNEALPRRNASMHTRLQSIAACLVKLDGHRGAR
jgi:hypothetical protein